MIIKDIIINNYKSIGNKRNKLKVDEHVTVLIGKNESGKSNILEAIGEQQIVNKLNPQIFNNKNRMNDEEISIEFVLQFTQEERKKLNLKDNNETIIHMSRDNLREIKGSLKDVIDNDTNLNNELQFVEDIIKNNDMKTDSSNTITYKKYVEELKKMSFNLDVDYNTHINSLVNAAKNKNFDRKEEYMQNLANIKKQISMYFEMLPIIYWRKHDRFLKSTYTLTEIKEIIKNKNELFYNLIKAAKIKDEEIIGAFENQSKPERKMIREKIEKNIKQYIEEPFNKFYKQDEINIIFEMDSNVVNIYIRSADKIMSFSERSNGLRWYIGLFIDVLAQKNNRENPILFLLDEPGVYLHVNAQKKVLELFQDLTKTKNQLIYTTHSPYMINEDEILKIRAIQKNDKEITEIYNNVYDQNLSKVSKMDTLSPIIQAIGADMKFSIGNMDKTRNIITEGITDYMYISAIMIYLKVKDKPYIIPSAGVANINRIASILLGWGCEFKIIVDYDNAGNKEYKQLNKKLCLELNKDVFYVNLENYKERIEEENWKTIESLIDEKDFKKLENKLDGTDEMKKLVAKEFYDKVRENNIELEEKTINNFKLLLRALDIL